MAKYYAVGYTEEFLAHYGRSKKDGAPIGSGRPSGSGGTVKISDMYQQHKTEADNKKVDYPYEYADAITHRKLKSSDQRYRAMDRYLSKSRKSVNSAMDKGDSSALIDYVRKMDKMVEKYCSDTGKNTDDRNVLMNSMLSSIKSDYYKKNKPIKEFDLKNDPSGIAKALNSQKRESQKNRKLNDDMHEKLKGANYEPWHKYVNDVVAFRQDLNSDNRELYEEFIRFTKH